QQSIQQLPQTQQKSSHVQQQTSQTQVSQQLSQVQQQNQQQSKVLELIELRSNNNNLDFTFASNIQVLTKALYNQQRRECAGLQLDPIKFEHMIENANPQLKGFFNYIINTIISKERLAYSINEAKKSIVGLCYMIA
ncbi:4966_t:CDS:2, partial [Acaulospora morrowiae]